MRGAINMKVKLKSSTQVTAEQGDFICFDGGDIRLITLIHDSYYAVDMQDGTFGMCESSIEDLIKEYNRCYSDVRIIKNKDMELIEK